MRCREHAEALPIQNNVGPSLHINATELFQAGWPRVALKKLQSVIVLRDEINPTTVKCCKKTSLREGDLTDPLSRRIQYVDHLATQGTILGGPNDPELPAR